MHVHCIHVFWICWNWAYEWLWDTMLVLGIKPSSSERATNAFNHWAIYLAPNVCYFVSYYIVVSKPWNDLDIFSIKKKFLCLWVFCLHVCLCSWLCVLELETLVNCQCRCWFIDTNNLEYSYKLHLFLKLLVVMKQWYKMKEGC